MKAKSALVGAEASAELDEALRAMLRALLREVSSYLEGSLVGKRKARSDGDVESRRWDLIMEEAREELEIRNLRSELEEDMLEAGMNADLRAFDEASAICKRLRKRRRQLAVDALRIENEYETLEAQGQLKEKEEEVF